MCTNLVVSHKHDSHVNFFDSSAVLCATFLFMAGIMKDIANVFDTAGAIAEFFGPEGEAVGLVLDITYQTKPRRLYRDITYQTKPRNIGRRHKISNKSSNTY